MLEKVQKQISISDFRNNLSSYFKQASKKPVVVSGTAKENPKVILDSDFYNKLIEAYEDYVDLEELMRARNDNENDYLNWEDVKKEL